MSMRRELFFKSSIFIRTIILIIFLCFSGLVYGYTKPDPLLANESLTPDEQNNIKIFKKTIKSVIYVTNSKIRRDPFSLNVQEIPAGAGTGFVWNKSGLIVTNYHVIQSADKVLITFYDQSSWTAKIVGVAPDKDLAVLKIEAPSKILFPVTVGDSNQLEVGRKVLAIGNPFGLDATLTVGVVSALGREIKAVSGRKIKGVIQTDAAINPGNSGGPLLNSRGELVGVNTAIFSPSGTNAGIGFAIPVNTVKNIIPQLIRYGRIQRPLLGIAMAEDSIARAYGIKGIIITRVLKNSPAYKAGLIGIRLAKRDEIILGDIIIELDQKRITNSDELFSIIEAHKPGDVLEVKTLRDNQKRRFKIRLGAPRNN